MTVLALLTWSLGYYLVWYRIVSGAVMCCGSFCAFCLAIALSVLLQFSLASSIFFEKGVKRQEIFVYPFEDSFKSFHKKQYSPRLVLDQKSDCNFNIAYWLKQQSACSHVAPNRRHYRDPETFALTSFDCLLSTDSANA
jgi:hypothetical protein